jgi:hypothetical protein
MLSEAKTLNSGFWNGSLVVGEGAASLPARLLLSQNQLDLR